MVRTAGPNYPGGQQPIDKVRRLQRKLYVAAKRNTGRRFHALYDRIHRSDVLLEAWKRVRTNKGAAGVDGVTLAAVEEYHAGQSAEWTRDWFWGQGLHRLRGPVRYPRPSMLHANTIVKPCAGQPHARFERRRVETGRA